MEELHLFENIAVVMTVTAAVAFITRILQQPLIIGHIISGFILGAAVLHVLEAEAVYEALSEIGVVFLLFIIGLGLKVKDIKEVGSVAVIAGVGQILMTMTFGFLFLALLSNFGYTEALYGAIGFSFSSTIIILKMLSDKKEQNRLYGKIAIGILLVQDLAATVGLIYLSTQSGEGLSAGDISLIGLKSLLLGAAVWAISTRLLGAIRTTIAGSQEFLFIFAIGWCFSVALLFQWAGLSIEVGALFAGLSLSQLPYSAEMAARLKPLRDFFIILFFIILGSSLSIESFRDLAPIVAASTVFVVLFNPLVIMVLLGLKGFAKKVSFKVAVSMGQVSEFSLIFLVLAASEGFITNRVVEFMTLVALFTIAISAYMMQYADRLYELLERRLTMFEKRKTNSEKHAQKHYSALIFGYEKGGDEFVRTFKAIKEKYVVIDYDPHVIDELQHNKTPYLYGDATDPEILAEIDLSKTRIAVATITDHKTNLYLLHALMKENKRMIFIGHSDTQAEADELYQQGATYVMIPHKVGSERVSKFLRKEGLSKTSFKKFVKQKKQ